MTQSFGEYGSLLKQAQRMQRELDAAREELKKRAVEGVAGGGAVRVTFGGDRSVSKVEIAPELLVKPDRALLEDLVRAAVRDGLERTAKLEAEALARVTGGVQLPGLF
jgi:hypothetical protein